MRIITILTTKEKATSPKDGTEYQFEINTLTLLRTAVNNTPAGGFAVTDMMDRLKLITAIDKVQKKYDEREKEKREKDKNKPTEEDEATEPIEGTDETIGEDAPDLKDKDIPEERPIVLKLEDALFEKLGGYMKTMTWGFISQTIVDLTELFNKK